MTRLLSIISSTFALFLVTAGTTQGANLRRSDETATTRSSGDRRRWLQFDLDIGSAWDDMVDTVSSIPEELGCLAFMGISCDEAKCLKVAPLGPEDFSLEEYIAKSWFMQSYQPEDDFTILMQDDELFCMVSTFLNVTEEDEEGEAYIQVQNSARIGSVNGTTEGYGGDDDFFSGIDLINEVDASCVQQVEGGSLQINSCLISSTIFSLLAGDYWVLAVADDYSWAIVSGGQTDEVVVEGTWTEQALCTTEGGSSFLDVDASGFWLLTREPQASEDTMTAMTDKLYELGIYSGDLKPVVQEGCTYPDATKF